MKAELVTTIHERNWLKNYKNIIVGACYIPTMKVLQETCVHLFPSAGLQHTGSLFDMIGESSAN